jgi:hypothetical protein
LFSTFQKAGIIAIHAGRVAPLLPRIAFMNGTSDIPEGRYDLIFANDGDPRAVLDIPVGEFVWDLMDAYPENHVILTVRPVASFICNDVVKLSV